MNATYDHRGNITSRLNGTGTEFYSWDLIDQLATRNFPSETHLYTVDGERVWTLQQSPAGLKETFTLRDLGGKVLSVFDKTSEVTTWKHDYIHRRSLQLGKATPAATPKDKVHFTLDHLGSTRVVTLDNGKTLETHHFFAYGEEFAGARASDEKLLFTGHERDKNGLGTVDDLDYMHARYYGPQLGRFLSVDPVLGNTSRPQSWNRYSYVGNNPIAFTEPSGLYVVSCGRLSAEECNTNSTEFEAGRQKLLTSKNQNIRAAAEAWGAPGEGNGITVVFEAPALGADGHVAHGFVGDGETGSVSYEGLAKIRPGQTGSSMAATVGHEGQHIIDARAFIATVTKNMADWNPLLNLTEFQAEMNAYKLSHEILLESQSTLRIPFCSCKLGQGVRAPEVAGAIEKILKVPTGSGGLYGVTSRDPGSRLFAGFNKE